MNPGRPSLLRRLAAAGYDLLLLGSVLFFATAIAVVLHGGGFAPGDLRLVLWLATVAALYFIWPWAHGGVTLGMLAWRLGLVTTDGRPCSWRRAGVRFAGALLGTAAGGLGWFAALLHPEGATWHDRLSGTRVVLDSRRGASGHALEQHERHHQRDERR